MLQCLQFTDLQIALQSGFNHCKLSPAVRIVCHIFISTGVSHTLTNKRELKCLIILSIGISLITSKVENLLLTIGASSSE